MRIAYALGLFAAISLLAGCPPASTTTCNADSDCKNGDVCRDGVCASTTCTPATFCRDVDGDTFGDPLHTSDGCVETGAPAGFVANCADCDDASPNIHPGATEIAADGIDQDCDGVDLCFVDGDGDGHGASSGATKNGASLDCDQAGAHTSSTDDDCDDSDPNAHPGANEIGGDGIDQDCDGHDNCFVDADDDGFGDPNVALVLAPVDAPTCDAPGISANGDDCDDSDANVHPGASEIVNDGVDQDCDGVDLCFVDADGDGHGDPNATAPGTSLDCGANLGASGVSNVGDDCDDTRADVHPGATEIPADDVDEDCDGVELCFVDGDGDGVGTTATVLAPQDPTCRTFGLSRTSNDCDDTHALVFPGAGEIVNDGIDQDCDGVDACFQDLDGDTFGSTVVVPGPSLHCSDGVGHGVTTNSADCDDHDAHVNPGAGEIANDGVDENCDGVELCFADTDGDGLGDPRAPLVASSSLSCTGPGVANNDDDCDDTKGGAGGQVCDDHNVCTVDVCGTHGVCTGLDENATCGCANDCGATSACCDVACGDQVPCPGCTSTRCFIEIDTSTPVSTSCVLGASCNITGAAASSLTIACTDSTCRVHEATSSSSNVTCTRSVCLVDSPSNSGIATYTCDASQCSGGIGDDNGIATFKCQNGARCDIACAGGGTCAIDADASSSYVFTCTAGACIPTCAGTQTSCTSNVVACNTACP